ncbi:MAG: flagellin [Candidatus Hydrogenedentota bacterium]
MGLKINTNVAGLRTMRILRRSTIALNKSLERLSSGLRVNRAADDAAGLAIAEGFRSVHRAAVVSQRNAQDGIGLVQTAEGALSETINVLQRIRELAVQSANGTNSQENRDDLQLEVAQLLDQMDSIADFTEFNGVFPLMNAVDIDLQVGPDALNIITLVFDQAADSLTLFGLSTSGNVPDISTQAGASEALLDIDDVLTIVNSQRSVLGAIQNRLEFTISTLQIMEENAVAAESSIRDADIARETIMFTRNQILVSSGTSILAQANIIPQTALQLLGG